MDLFEEQQPVVAAIHSQSEEDSDSQNAESELELDYRERATARQVSSLKKDIATFTAEAEFVDSNLEFYEQTKITEKSPAVIKTAINDLQTSLSWLQKVFKNILVAKAKFIFAKEIALLIAITKTSYEAKNRAIKVLLNDLTEQLSKTEGGSVVEDSQTREKKDVTTPNFRSDEFFYKHLLPKVELTKFDGQTLADSMAYYRFRTSFMEVVVRRATLPGAIKLTFLKANLTGPAYQAVAHFTTEDANFDLALKTLDDLYLDKDKIIRELWRNLRSLKPNKAKDDCAFSNIVEYISNAKGIISDLKTMGIDCEESNVGNIFCAQIIFESLPFVVQNEIIIKVNTNYPDLKQIFETYPFALNKLMLKYQHMEFREKQHINKFQQSNRNNPNSAKINVVASKGQTKNKAQTPLQRKSHNTVERNLEKPEQSSSYAVVSQAARALPAKNHGYAEEKRNCRLCSSKEHSSSKCTEFSSVDARINRIKDLDLCTKCMSSRHDSSQCTYITLLFPFACQLCDSRKHITPLCDKLHSRNK